VWSRHILSRIATLTGDDMLRRSILAVLLVLFVNLADADALPVRDATRGELLYSTHCIACHSSQVHWREKKLVTDWTSLQSQVRRWQEVSGLGWSNEDIAEVARYLNALHYRYPSPN
jgi:mono/diheme cytochrome c family protein